MRLLASNQIEKNAGWGAEWHLDKGFRAAGIEVDNVDYKKYQFRLCQEFSRLEGKEYDGFFLQRGDFFPHDILSALPGPRVFWATELVARRKDQWKNIQSSLFDHVFVRSIPCLNTVVNNGWRDPESVSVLSSGFSEDVFFSQPGIDKDIDVVFVGSSMPRRNRILDEIEKHVSVVRARVYGDEMNRLFNRARIVLNLHSEDHLDTETRVYEALGSGSFLLTEPLSSENPFCSGKHLVIADGVEEIVEKIRYYLANNEEREDIAARGLQAAKDHSYHSHAEAIIRTFQRLRGNGHSTATVDVRRLRQISKKEPFRAAKWRANRFLFRVRRKFKHILRRRWKR